MILSKGRSLPLKLSFCWAGERKGSAIDFGPGKLSVDVEGLKQGGERERFSLGTCELFQRSFFLAFHKDVMLKSDWNYLPGET